MKTAFITGITGQDGYYLSKLLLEKGYIVHGTIRRSSSINTSRIDDLISEFQPQEKLILHYSDLLDSASIFNLINYIEPDEIYNLAAQSHVSVSFQNPIFTTQTGTLGSLSILEAIRRSKKEIKFYQASSSEMFGGAAKVKLNEQSILDPKSPYAVSKVFAHHMTKVYRDSYSLFTTNGILFNHESPRRGETFVTRKITRALSRIKLGSQKCLYLGNLDAKRDWGHAKDYVRMQWMMLQEDIPQDFVIATGVQYSVRDFVNLAAKEIDLLISWEGQGINEKGYDQDGNCIVSVDPQYFRPAEVETLLGDATQAKKVLGWEPEISFEELVSEMASEDMKIAKRDLLISKDG